MARKYDEIKWLAQATAQDLSADTEKWKGFLRDAISNIHAEYEAVELSADELGSVSCRNWRQR